MRPKLKVRTGDEVIAIAGKDAGKTGEIIKVLRDKNRVIVRGINTVRRHVKASADNPEGGIVVKEASIHVSNIAHVDPSTGKPTRVGYKILKDGTKVRYSKKSDEVIDKA